MVYENYNEYLRSFSSNPRFFFKTLEEILKRDALREKDGFKRKIKYSKIIKPGKNGKNKVIIKPFVEEEKLYHAPIPSEDGEGQSSGSGEGEEGDIVGQQPLQGDGDGDGGEGPGGDGDSENHDIESEAYELGKVITDQFKLPDIKDKGKKKSLVKYHYDLTDKNIGSGQLLDKKSTLKKIVKTNMALGRINLEQDIDTSKFLISPQDKVYRVLSKEKDYESQALVFFMRDYSGSMMGMREEIICSQHLLLYSWLKYQYENRVESRFILHDTGAREVPDFYTYWNSRVAGGTKIASGFKLMNEIVKKENLERDYNIYVFYGTDGDDSDREGKEAVPEIKKMLNYTNRAGFTVVNGYSENTEFEQYLKRSNLLNTAKNLRMDHLKEDVDQERLMEGIRKLVSEK
jgi:uncharacterized sporulation protein YeaH/YhbH (DUF444 family)